MKKLLILLETLLIITTVSGCDIVQKSEMAIALANMETMDSYRMDITLELDGETFVESYAYVVGEYQEIYILDTVQSLFLIDNMYYTIHFDYYGFPTLEATTRPDDEDYSEFDLFLDYEFEVDDDGYYVLTSEVDMFDGVTTVKFKIEDRKIKEMVLNGEMDVLGETFNFDSIIVYSEYNEVDIPVPVYLTDEEITQFDTY